MLRRSEAHPPPQRDYQTAGWTSIILTSCQTLSVRYQPVPNVAFSLPEGEGGGGGGGWINQKAGVPDTSGFMDLAVFHGGGASGLVGIAWEVGKGGVTQLCE